jgi:hypothetical protein
LLGGLSNLYNGWQRRSGESPEPATAARGTSSKSFATTLPAMKSNHFNIVLAFACLSIGCNRAAHDPEPVAPQTKQAVTPREPDRAAAKSFGERQLDQMLQDRPDMRDVIPNSHSVFQWLVDGFNGDRIGQRVYWNASSPQSGRPAEHGPAYGTYPPYIAISGGTETTPIDKWAAVVYEMHNLENGDKFGAISRLAIAGRLDADAFAEKCVELEFVALTKTQEFFRENPLPNSKHEKDVWYNWVTSNMGTFEDYRNSFDVPGTNVFNSNFAYFKEYYDTTIVPYADAIRRRKR